MRIYIFEYDFKKIGVQVYIQGRAVEVSVNFILLVEILNL